MWANRFACKYAVHRSFLSYLTWNSCFLFLLFLLLQARQILDKDAESRSCVSNNGFLVLFHGPHHHGCAGAGVGSVPSSGTATISGNNLTLTLDAAGAGGACGGGGAMAISPAKSHNSITTEMKT